jgi:glutamate synthase (NADPH/NADH) small chain
LRVEIAHEEGDMRDWSVFTVRFTGDEDGNVKRLQAVRVDGKLQAIPGMEFTVDVELALLAMGFLGPFRDGMIEQLSVKLDKRDKRREDGVRCAGA